MSGNTAEPLLPGPLLIDLAGTELTAEEQALLRHPLVGGVVLFTRNYRDPAQLAELTGAIHETGRNRLLITVDQEGGRVQRFRAGFTRLPASALLGRLWEQDAQAARQRARDQGLVMALECRARGVDCSFAPVLDLDFGFSQVIGDRALHADPQVVAELAMAFCAGVHLAGLPVVIKHFPGHGGIAPDTHTELATDNRIWQELYDQDLLPFRRLIAHGSEGVMLAHIRYPGVDQEVASFSAVWIQRVLRGAMGFRGAVFSDDMSMAGAAGGRALSRRVTDALRAGCDWVLLCNDRPGLRSLLDGLSLEPEDEDPASRSRRADMVGRLAGDPGGLLLDPHYLQARDRLLNH